MDIIDTINEVIMKLNKLEEYMNNLNKQLSVVDQKKSDIEHFIENKKLNMFQAYKVYKELYKVLLERRKIKNDIELTKVFRANDTKLIKIKNRESLLEDLKTRNNDLNCEYNNKVYSKEELENIVGGKENE